MSAAAEPVFVVEQRTDGVWEVRRGEHLLIDEFTDREKAIGTMLRLAGEHMARRPRRG